MTEIKTFAFEWKLCMTEEICICFPFSKNHLQMILTMKWFSEKKKRHERREKGKE